MLSPSRARRISEFAVPWLAVAIPGLTAAQRVASESVWRDDLPIVRGIGLAPIGGASTLTSVAMQAASLVPFGPLTLRMAIISTIALSLCAYLAFAFARRVLETHVPGSFLNAPLAGIGALCATLGPALQGEATVAGGATIPIAAGLLVLLIATNQTWQRERRHTLAAIVLGALVAESIVAAGAVLIAVLACVIVRKDRARDSRAWTQLIIPTIAMTTVAATMMLPSLLRPSSPHAALNFGHSLSQFDLPMVDPVAQPVTGLDAWIAEVGIVTLVIAVLGAVIGLVRTRTRWLVVPLLVVVAVDALLPATKGGVLITDMLTPMRSFAITAVAICACVGVQTVVTTLSDTGLLMAKATAVLVLVFDLALVAVTAERAAFSIDRTATRGATAYTDEALLKLEPNAMVLARSQTVVWRLLAAQVTSGMRPDVVVVPLPIIGRGTVAAGVLAVEPGASMLLRDIALDGTASEHAISRISDRRRVYAELDPSWKETIAIHLRANGLWLSLEPHPLGRSDRRIAAANSAKTVDRVAKTALTGEPSDSATRSVLLSVIRQQAVAAALAKDRQATSDLLAKMSAVAPEDLFVRSLRQRVEHADGSTIDVSGLLR
ncbi:MAG: hypothetical protein FWD57_03780 [Polyangiaceae bacterium]|nr:hypothetical protein [Polyangiaceae bacterium]